jgi:hypothetical protein
MHRKNPLTMGHSGADNINTICIVEDAAEFLLGQY